MAQTLTLLEMAIRGVRFRWRSTVALALGVATAVTVIVGALLVGDSMRGSLRQLTLERLGKIETMILPGGFFESEGLVDPSVRSEPLIWFPSGVVEAKRDDGSGIIRRAGSVQIVASDPTFWELDTADIRPKATPGFDEVILNEAAARELDVAIGDNVTVRLPVEGAVPADSPLGRRDATTEGLPRLKVIDILPNRGLGRFAVIPNQATPKTAFLARSLVADTLERDGQANAIVSPSPLTMDQINVDLADTGMKLQRVRQSFGDDDETVFQYDCLTSDRLLLPEAVVDRLQDSSTSDGTSAAPIMTYLANAIEKLDDDGNVVASTVYGTVTAADSSDGLPLDYTLPDDGDSDRIPLVINSWTAEKLDAEVGTPLRIAYYEPEVEAGNEIERYADAIVTQIVPITRPAKPFRGNRPAVYETRPTLYNDPDLTPTVPGVTDQESMDRWDTPFELTRTIDRPDDTYYKDHRLTSKAFMPLADGRRLFASRFGQTTGLRFSTTSKVSPEGNVSPALASRIDRELEDLLPELGWTVIPVRQQQLDASRGTTPFDALFLSLSFFVILASVLLIAMLMRLSLTQRLKQLGTLLAVGWTPSRVRRLVVGESLLVAAFGGVVGIAGGVAYAQFILWALRSWWVGAVTVPFLSFHWSVGSVLIGLLVGWGIAAITLTLIARRLLRTPPTDLLGGRTEASTGAETNTKRRSFGWQKPLMVATAIAAMGLAAFSAVSGGQAAAGGFVGAGMLLLGTFLLAIDARLRRPRRIGGEGGQPFSVGQLSSRNATRNPTRSTLSIALMATAAFLIVAMGAFRLQPTRRGTGGFDLMGQSSQPLFRDLADSKIQANLLGIDADALADSQILPLRLRPGQDASCNNLYQATRPTVLGIPQRFSQLVSSDDRFGFDFVGGMDPASSPWVQLEESARGTQGDPVPVVIDQNTAMWSLQMHGGVGEVRSFEFDAGKPIWFRVAGLLSGSTLQGKLLIGETNFESLFSEINGYRFFLIASDPKLAVGSDELIEKRAEVASVLESRLGDVGMDVTPSAEVLAGLLAVQNTYLRTFQSLGALGLLLGTIGLAVAQLRSVLERRRELAVMRAIGFTPARLGSMVLGETAVLLLVGIGCGTLCAVLAVLPHAVVSGVRPPVGEPVVVLLGILLFGMLAGLAAVSRVVRMPLVGSLRAD